MNEQHFYCRLKPNGDCWEWTGCIDTRGYGSLVWQGRQTRAHRLAYNAQVQRIRLGLQWKANV